jgi:hypothetical protein
MLQKENYERQECRFVSFLAGIVGNGSTVPSKSFTLVLVYCKTVSWEMTAVPLSSVALFRRSRPPGERTRLLSQSSIFNIYIYSGHGSSVEA